MDQLLFFKRAEWIISIISALSGGCNNSGQVGFTGGRQMRALTERESADLTRVVAQEFSAGSLHLSHTDINTGFNDVDQTLSLHQASRTVETIKQTERRQTTASFSQGSDGWQASESFGVKEKGLLDLLIVVDNSPSTKLLQQRFGQSLKPLLKYIANTNWQIAVDTTSTACLNKTKADKRSITRDDYDKDPTATEQTFEELINVGDSGNTNEMGVRYATDGMIGNCGDPKDDWKRAGSRKAVLIITDEKNCGSGSNEGCPGDPWEKAEYFTSRAPAGTSVNGLFLLKDNYDICPDSGGYGVAEYPTEYIRLVNMTGGKFGEVCQADYSGVLEDISAGIGDTIIQKFPLKYAPVAGSVTALLDGSPLADGFTIEDNFIVMTKQIPATALTIVFTYRHDAATRTDKYILPSAPDPQTIDATVNGGIVSPQAFSFDTATNTLQFKTMPPDRADIEVKYRDNSALPTQFALDNSKPILEGSVTVQVNGHDVNNVTFDTLKDALTFQAAPLDGSIITVSYARPEDKMTSYKIEGIDPGIIEKASFYDAESKTPIVASIVDGVIHVPMEDVYEGRLVVAHYDPLFKGSALDFSVPLAYSPLEGTLGVTDNSGEKIDCGEDAKLDGSNRLAFSCANDHMTKIAIEYTYLTDYTNVFTFDGALLPGAVWQVTVNGKMISDYELIDETFTIPQEILPPGAKVVITRTPPKVDAEKAASP